MQDFVYLGDKGPVLMRFHVRIDGKPLLDVWEDFMGKLFAYLDQNGDGVLSKEEAARVPPMQVLFNNAPNFVGQRPNFPGALDQNRDGKITRAELADWYRRIGATPFQFRTGGLQQQQQVLVVRLMRTELNRSPMTLSTKSCSPCSTPTRTASSRARSWAGRLPFCPSWTMTMTTWSASAR